MKVLRKELNYDVINFTRTFWHVGISLFFSSFISLTLLWPSFQVMEVQQRKCSFIFDLSCNLARVLEFCTREIPQAFLLGADTNLRRLTEIIVFILSQLTSAVDPEFLDL